MNEHGALAMAIAAWGMLYGILNSYNLCCDVIFALILVLPRM
jgi:hypothetical protein